MPSYNDVDKVAITLDQCTKNGRGNEWIARCPFCLDSKKSKFKKRFHLTYFSDNEIKYHCFNCGVSGNFYNLYAHLKGIDETEAYAIFNRNFDVARIKENIVKPEREFLNKKKEHKIFNYMLDYCVSTPDTIINKKLLDVLAKFRIDRKIDSDYKLYITSNDIQEEYLKKYRTRIFIPVYDEDHNIVFFQARGIFPSQNDEKYLNSVTDKDNIIFNKSYFDKNKYIIVTEGLIDAMSVNGHQGTSVLGCSIHDSFFKKLYKYTNMGVILALDNDDMSNNMQGQHKMYKYFSGNNKYSNELKYFIMPDKYKHLKDMNDVKCKSEEKDIYNFVINNSYDGFMFKIKMSGVLNG